MRPAGKIACLFLIILVSPLYAQTGPEELIGGEFFFEELFLFEETFAFEKIFMNDNFLLDDEASIAEEAQSDGETLLADETLIAGITRPGEEALLSGAGASAEAAAATDEDALPAEDTPLDEETLLAEETPIDEDDDYFDEDAFFFEAPAFVFEVPTFEPRSFDELFPNLTSRQKTIAMSNLGLRNSFVKDEEASFVPNPDYGIDLLDKVKKKNPSHIIETLMLVPYNGRELDQLDIYNAVGRIEKIKDYAAVYNGNNFYAFSESTRITSAGNRKAIPDPTPASVLPLSQTIYLRLHEVTFGNLFLRGDISASIYGITYSMTNFTAVRYFLIPLMKAERFIAAIYLEPVKEGILIYSVSGFYIPGFIADRVNLTPSINRRIEIFIKWITDGLGKGE